MAKKAALSFNENELSKGELRKLTALRKSLGEDIANKAFAEWYEKQDQPSGAASDENAELIASTLWPMVESKQLVIPKTGYVVRRGRGRVIVESAKS